MHSGWFGRFALIDSKIINYFCEREMSKIWACFCIVCLFMQKKKNENLIVKNCKIMTINIVLNLATWPLNACYNDSILIKFEFYIYIR